MQLNINVSTENYVEDLNNNTFGVILLTLSAHQLFH